ncbi:hypothetical protein LCGC14_2665560, partial [marine sediment metagenome]
MTQIITRFVAAPLVAALFLAVPWTVSAQTSIDRTTLSAAVAAGDLVINVASATGIAATGKL